MQSSAYKIAIRVWNGINLTTVTFCYIGTFLFRNIRLYLPLLSSFATLNGKQVFLLPNDESEFLLDS